MTRTKNSEPIAITGMGLVTSLGLDAESIWHALCRGECGVGPPRALESLLEPDPGAGQVKAAGTEPAEREVVYLRRALHEALQQARATADRGEHRRGLLVGTTLHGMRRGGRFLRTEDFTTLRGFLAGSTLASIADCAGDLTHACTTCSACSSGLASVSLAETLLAAGEIDLAIAGGYDPISEYSYAGFNSMRLVSPTTVRPFAADRDGMKVAEGYAVVVLECEQDAISRGTRPLAYLLGMGESCDAFHLSKPHPEGAGAAAAIQRAMDKAGVAAPDIDLIIAHGTATIENDAAEYAALKQIFGDRLAQVPLLPTKSHLGHSLGAAGAVDLIIGVQALRDGLIPPCANLRPEAALIGGLNPIRGAPSRAALRHVLTVSLGFGGANVACILGAAPRAKPALPFTGGSQRSARPRAEARVAVSGVGVVVPGGAGNGAFVRLLAKKRQGQPSRASTVTQEELEPLINARRTRRMSEFAKLAIAATGEALREAGVADTSLFCEECSAILATMHGPTEFCELFYRQIVQEGPAAASPSLFAEGVPNVASAHLSTTFGIRGFCQTLIGSRTAGLHALSLAFARIRAGQWPRAIVGAAEEYTPLLHEVYARLLPSGEGDSLLQTSAAVALVLEPEDSLRARGGRPLAFIEETISRHLPQKWLRARRSLREAAEFLGPVDAHCCAMNGTWIDSLECRMLPGKRRAAADSIYQLVGESFSAAPLLGLAGALLRGKEEKTQRATLPAAEESAGGRLGVLCADYFGSVAAARITLA